YRFRYKVEIGLNTYYELQRTIDSITDEHTTTRTKYRSQSWAARYFEVGYVLGWVTRTLRRTLRDPLQYKAHNNVTGLFHLCQEISPTPTTEKRKLTCTC
ncbi:unnamed protein product, partial [Ectocarpus fasciculatus]